MYGATIKKKDLIYYTCCSSNFITMFYKDEIRRSSSTDGCAEKGIRQSWCENMRLREHLVDEVLDGRKVLLSITEIVFEIHAGVS